jgi:hypothetical protein
VNKSKTETESGQEEEMATPITGCAGFTFTATDDTTTPWSSFSMSGCEATCQKKKLFIGKKPKFVRTGESSGTEVGITQQITFTPLLELAVVQY